MFSRILVPIDGSPLSLRAVECAAEIAQRYHAAVTLLLVSDFDAALGGALAEPFKAAIIRDITDANDALLEKAALPLQQAGIATTARQLMGKPAAVITGEVDVEGIDLVVMGSHGLGQAGEGAIGSVTDRVLRRVRCPVLVIQE